MVSMLPVWTPKEASTALVILDMNVSKGQTAQVLLSRFLFHSMCNIVICFSPDINECLSANSSELCGEFSNCVNTPGSYDCECQQGYTGNGTEGICIGIFIHNNE